MASVGVPTAAARLPITYAASPIVAAAACVSGAGSRPSRRTRPVAGLNASTASDAVPAGSEPPAITSCPATDVTAA